MLYGKTLGVSARPYAAWKTGQDSLDVQPLRIGLVSGDLRNHPAGFFLESILQHLYPARVELVAYPTQSLEDDRVVPLATYIRISAGAIPRAFLQ